MKVKYVRSAGVEPVYNMTVEEFHNYLIHGGIILKNCDALRYFVQFRTLGAIRQEAREEAEPGAALEDYDEAMCGGDADESYLLYG